VKNLILISAFVCNFFNSDGQCLQAGFGPDPSVGETSKSCGDEQMDNRIKSLVSRINNVFGTRADFYFYDDADAHNASANPNDMNIYIGLHFLEETKNSSSGITGIAFLLAHELSHIYQFSTRDNNKYMEDPTVKNCELQADYLAAYVLGRLNLVTGTNYDKMLGEAVDIGDVQFNDEDHHGTYTERKAVAIWGYTYRLRGLETTYRDSYSHIDIRKNNDNHLVYVLKFNSGKILYVLYGGKICEKDDDGSYNQIAQWTTNIGNQQVPYLFEFSKNPSENLYMDINNIIMNINGQIVGRGVPIH